MLSITKEELEIEETLNKKINNLCSFLNIENKIINGNILNIEKTNIAYIEPHKLKIKDNDYLFFNGSDEVFINDLSSSTKITDLLSFIRNN